MEIVYNRLCNTIIVYRHFLLKRSLKKFIFRYQDLVEIYSVSAEKIINDGFSYSENV
jgi:hypothetical protein